MLHLEPELRAVPSLGGDLSILARTISIDA